MQLPKDFYNSRARMERIKDAATPELAEYLSPHIIDNCTPDQFDEFVSIAEKKDAAIKHSRHRPFNNNNSFNSNKRNNHNDRHKRQPSYSASAQTSNNSNNFKKKTPFKKFDKLSDELRCKIIEGNGCLY